MYTTTQLKTIPPLIDKRKQTFIPLVKRPRIQTAEFRALVIGKHFKFYETAKGVDQVELELILVKQAASNVERNARVVSTPRAKMNPVGQIWTVDGMTPVIEINFP